MAPTKAPYLVTVLFKPTATMIWMSSATFVCNASSPERAEHKVQRQCLLAGMNVRKVKAEPIVIG